MAGSKVKQVEDNLLLSRIEVQDQFGISVRLLQDLASRGQGPSLVRLGRLVRYRVADIESWILSQRVDPTGDRHG